MADTFSKMDPDLDRIRSVLWDRIRSNPDRIPKTAQYSYVVKIAVFVTRQWYLLLCGS